MRRARMDYDATTHGISASIHRTRMRQLRNSILGGLDRAFEAPTVTKYRIGELGCSRWFETVKAGLDKAVLDLGILVPRMVGWREDQDIYR